MTSWKKTLAFSVVVTLVLNAIDMSFHYSAGTAVHLNYVAVKLTIIFLSVYLISQFVGISARDGIVASLFGPFMFWLYYFFAYPTLDREVFWLDEQFTFMFLHIAMMFVAYFSSYWWMIGKFPRWRKLFFLISASFASLAIYLLALMINLKIQGIPEEEAVNMITFADDWKALLIVMITIGFGLLIQPLLCKKPR